VTRLGGRLFLLFFSDEEPGCQGPGQIFQAEIRYAFSGVWEVEEVRASRYEARPNLKGLSFSKGGAEPWFSVIRRPGGPIGTCLGPTYTMLSPPTAV